MTATGIGALLGLLLGGLLFPLGGLLLSAGGGALVGRLIQLGIDGDFVKQVSGVAAARHARAVRTGT